MALGTIDFTQVKVPYDTAGVHRRAIGDYSGPGAAAGGYPTGGDLVAGGDFKLIGNLELVDFVPAYNGTVIKTFFWNPTTSKIMSFDAAGTETANGTDLSAYKARFEAIGE